MAADPENLVLVYLRRIDGKVDVVQRDLTEVKQRLEAVEIGLASVRRDIAFLAETDARMQDSMDRILEDVD